MWREALQTIPWHMRANGQFCQREKYQSKSRQPAAENFCPWTAQSQTDWNMCKKVLFSSLKWNLPGWNVPRPPRWSSLKSSVCELKKKKKRLWSEVLLQWHHLSPSYTCHEKRKVAIGSLNAWVEKPKFDPTTHESTLNEKFYLQEMLICLLWKKKKKIHVKVEHTSVMQSYYSFQIKICYYLPLLLLDGEFLFNLTVARWPLLSFVRTLFGISFTLLTTCCSSGLFYGF